MIQIPVNIQTVQFEAAPVLLELTCRSMIGKLNSERPEEGAPVVAVRNGIRSDFAAAIGTALKAEESKSRNFTLLLPKVEGSGLDVIGAELGTPRLESETDTDYRLRLEVANEVTSAPLHAAILQAGEAVLNTLLESPSIQELVSSLGVTYGI